MDNFFAKLLKDEDFWKDLNQLRYNIENNITKRKCYCCKKEFQVDLKWEKEVGTMNKERYMSGTCSDKCWDRMNKSKDFNVGK